MQLTSACCGPQQMDNLNNFLVENSVPKQLSARLRDFYRYRNSNVTVHGSMSILNTLCPELRMEVADYTDVYWLQRSDLFSECGHSIEPFGYANCISEVAATCENLRRLLVLY